MCRENVVAIKAGKLEITFSSCNPEPHYLTHIPVGLSYSNDVYNLGKLLNSYADSGRFEVEAGSEELKLKVKNILLSDAGMYTCKGDSGHGERHNKELVVLGKNNFIKYCIYCYGIFIMTKRIVTEQKTVILSLLIHLS